MTNDPEKLIDPYLHGELTDEELESFEATYFLDDDLFEQIETAEMRLIDRYVRSEMAPAEAARFESGYLTTADRSRKVAEARAFHRELERFEPEGKGLLAGLFEKLSFQVSILQFASAATILLVSIGILWAIWILQTDPQPVAEANVNVPEIPVNTDVNGAPFPRQPDDQITNGNETPVPSPTLRETPSRQGVSNPVFATLAPIPGMRSTNTYRVVRITDRTTRLDLTIRLPESAPEGDYVVAIRDESGRQIWMRGSIPSRPNGKGQVLTVTLSPEDLRPGRFRVIAEKESDDTAFPYGLEILVDSANGN